MLGGVGTSSSGVTVNVSSLSRKVTTFLILPHAALNWDVKQFSRFWEDFALSIVA